MLKRLLIFTLSAFFILPSYAQTHMTDPYKKQWAKADSLLNSGLPKSAQEVIETILQSAEGDNDRPNVIKAQVYLLAVTEENTEGSDTMHIRKAEQYIAQSNGVEKAVWQSITAGMYWQYYQNYRWQIYNRTQVAETTSPDIATWDAAAFFRKISELFQASIAARDALKKTPVENYLPVIIEGINTRHMRPTLYDVLVFRAISFFENVEKDVVNPAFRFNLEDEQYFSPAGSFVKTAIQSQDSNSLHLQALQLFQEIIRFHLNDPHPDALIDADLHRLEFVKNNFTGAGKDSLYLDALRRIESTYPNNKEAAIASYRIVASHTSPDDYDDEPSRHDSADHIAAAARLRQIIASFPESEAASLSQYLLNRLEASHFNLKAEQVILPDENSKVLLTYKNINKAYFTLYQLPVNPVEEREDRYNDAKKLSKLKVIKKWESDLPGTTDLKTHSTEIKIDALPAGRYLLAVSRNAEIIAKKNTLATVQFAASGISMITNNSENEHPIIYALDRKTGAGLGKVKAIFYQQKWDNKKGYYIYTKLEESISNAEGAINLPNVRPDEGSYRYSSVMLIQGNDSLYMPASMYSYYRDNVQAESYQTFIFTDRSIYRPGQTVYFKAISLRVSADNRSQQVLANQPIVVTFYDGNNQDIQTLSLNTNEFGSVTGSFIAPENGLTGIMRIGTDYGSTSFSVEEYKRPKFFVEFDTLRDSYALNQQVKIKGFAKTYSGTQADGAQVKYRVVRNARFPYYWCYYRWGMPNSPQMEIKNGTATTQADGSFEIIFETIPDKMVDPKSAPVFTYTVYADVTDVNGETRSGQQIVNAAYQNLQIVAVVPEDAHPERLKSVTVTTQNFNNVFVPAALQMSITPLLSPGKLYRTRLWKQPDQFLLTESEYRRAFPDDEYKDEGNYLNWQKGTAVFEKNITTTKEGIIDIPEDTWKNNGWYVIEFKSKDASGKEIVEKKYVHIWNPENKSPVHQPLLAQTNRGSYQPGEEAKVYLGTAFEAHILGRSTLKDKAVRTYSTPLAFEKKLTEADRGGIAFNWVYVYNNRVYQTSATIPVDWNNKDLSIDWATHRDKLQPGAGDEWTMTIKGSQKEKAAAELLAGMYDASLDAFRAHTWYYNAFRPYAYLSDQWQAQYGFGVSNGQLLEYWAEDRQISYDRQYDRLLTGNETEMERHMPVGYGGREMRRMKNMSVSEDAVAAPSAAMNSQEMLMTTTGKVTEEGALEKKEAAPAPPPPPPPATNVDIQIRTNFAETAFFFPQLQTDAEGNIKIKFAMPEALTEWRLMTFAHTKDWKTGYMEGKIKTQKDLMVVPNLPRFLRQGDDIVIASKINSLTDVNLNGTASLEILNAATLQPMALPFRLQNASQAFTVAKGQSTTVSWSIHVPEFYEPVIFRIVAKAGNFSDGEENTLPIVTNRTLVTETLPLPVRGNQEQAFTLDKLINASSNTLVNRALTVEFTGNPAWYAVQALPYLMEYPYECAEQTFNRFYANALAGHIVSQSPKVEAIFNQWKNEDTAALISNLSKNEELKSALLEETPWVMEAQNETEQKHRIVSLFQTHKLSKELKKNLDKLESMQLAEGGFPWFKGMRSDRYITQYITTGIARLQHLGVSSALKNDADKILDKALPYLDREMKEDYDNLIKYKSDLENQNIGYAQIQYLYMRSFYTDKRIPATSQKAFEYYKKQAVKYWPKFNPYMKGMIALALDRWGDKATAANIVASLKETAIEDKEIGMYWKEMPRGYWWYEAPIEAQALLVETFKEVAKDEKAADELKVWLLKQKQTQNWETTKATADACYALLLSGSDWLVNEPQVTIQLGNDKTIRSAEIKTEAGTGYFKQRIEGKDVTPGMGHIKVQVDNAKNEGVSWGAVYWQYFEDLDKITPAATPLALSKQLFIERNSDRGPLLTEIKEGNEIKIGDKVIIRIILKADRDMEYIHLKDMRAACFEPVNVLSQYKYQAGLGYYESTKDVSTNFFFDRINKGTYVFEYPVFVQQQGDFSNGIATVQCMYAPEFSSHSDGIRVRVK